MTKNPNHLNFGNLHQLVNCNGKDFKEIFSIYAEFYYNQPINIKRFGQIFGSFEEYINKDLGPSSAETDFSKALKEKKIMKLKTYLEILKIYTKRVHLLL